MAGARILSGTLTSGDPPLERVAGEMEESSDSTDREVASSIRRGVGDGSSHKEAVKTHGLACGGLIIIILTHTCRHTYTHYT